MLKPPPAALSTQNTATVIAPMQYQGEPTLSNAPPCSFDDSPGEGALGLLIVVARHRRVMLASIAVSLALSVGLLFLMPKRYTATTTILPPQQNQSVAASMLGQLGNASGLLGLAGSGVGFKNPNDMYIGVLKSRTIADSIIEQFHLAELYAKKTLWDTRKELAKHTDISSGKDTLVVVAVDDIDQKRAAGMANAYIEQLTVLTRRLALTEASQRRLFYERQLIETKDELSKAEQALKSSQQTSGLVQPDSQARAIIQSVAEVRAQIAAKEVQLKAMRTYATAQNPSMVLAEEELAGLREQSAKLERLQNSGAGNLQIPVTRLPEAGLEYVRRLRDVKYYETMFELLSRQFEVAKLDEARQAALIQVVDQAVQPDKNSSPKPLVFILIGVVSGILFGVLYAGCAENYFTNPASRTQLRKLLHLLFKPLA